MTGGCLCRPTDPACGCGTTFPDRYVHPDPAVRELVAAAVAQARAEALREAARFFEYEMSKAWGGDASWFSTGNKVADVVADVLRERADEATATEDGVQ